MKLTFVITVLKVKSENFLFFTMKIKFMIFSNNKVKANPSTVQRTAKNLM